MLLSPGAVIADRYELVRPLGAGAMGEVWVARDRRLHTPCAVKVLKLESHLQDGARQRFALEARSAAQLRSPHVVQILDHGEDREMPYIAMELLEGEDLAARLARVGRPGLAATLSIVEQIGKALTRAHAAGVVHRDLKPANVFIAREAEGETVKVLDFGLAKSLIGDGPASVRAGATRAHGANATRAGAILGTPNYMSPEQIEGAGAVDTRTDLWSLAVLTFECLTGRIPFVGENLATLFVKIQTDPLPRPTDLAPDLPPSVDAWFARACARDRSARFQSARELVEALAGAIGTGHATDTGTGPTAAVGGSPHNLAFAPTFYGPDAPASPALPIDAGAPTERAGASGPSGKRRGMALGVGVGVLVLAAIAVVVGIQLAGPDERSKSERDDESSDDDHPRGATSAARSAKARATAVGLAPKTGALAPTAPAPPGCEVTRVCPDPLHQICSLANGLGPPACVPSKAGANIQLSYDGIPNRWTGPARLADGSVREQDDFGQLRISFGEDSRLSPGMIIVGWTGAPPIGTLPISPRKVFVQVDEGRYPVAPKYHGTYYAKGGTVTVTSVDWRYGGHVDGSLETEFSGGSGKEPIRGTLKMAFHAEFPTPGQ